MRLDGIGVDEVVEHVPGEMRIPVRPTPIALATAWVTSTTKRIRPSTVVP